MSAIGPKACVILRPCARFGCDRSLRQRLQGRLSNNRAQKSRRIASALFISTRAQPRL
ncbi:hypothetical protein EMIT0P201_20082 [Pseudomonas chlororaphis]